MAAEKRVHNGDTISIGPCHHYPSYMPSLINCAPARSYTTLISHKQVFTGLF
jgi:hypothetical protein